MSSSTLGYSHSVRFTSSEKCLSESRHAALCSRFSAFRCLSALRSNHSRDIVRSNTSLAACESCAAEAGVAGRAAGAAVGAVWRRGRREGGDGGGTGGWRNWPEGGGNRGEEGEVEGGPSAVEGRRGVRRLPGGCWLLGRNTGLSASWGEGRPSENRESENSPYDI